MTSITDNKTNKSDRSDDQGHAHTLTHSLTHSHAHSHTHCCTVDEFSMGSVSAVLTAGAQLQLTLVDRRECSVALQQRIAEFDDEYDEDYTSAHHCCQTPPDTTQRSSVFCGLISLISSAFV